MVETNSEHDAVVHMEDVEKQLSPIKKFLIGVGVCSGVYLAGYAVGYVGGKAVVANCTCPTE